jgi:hypothetical protein
VFHRLEPHVLLCWLALLLIRVAERRTGQTWRTLARELGRLHAITLTGTGRNGRAVHRTHYRPGGAFFGPADSPRHPGSPPSTPPEQQKHPHPALGQAWTFAYLVGPHTSPQGISPRLRPSCLFTHCGTRGAARPVRSRRLAGIRSPPPPSRSPPSRACSTSSTASTRDASLSSGARTVTAVAIRDRSGGRRCGHTTPWSRGRQCQIDYYPKRMVHLRLL